MNINKILEAYRLRDFKNRGIFKAVFMVGGPGSGKSLVSKKLLQGTAGWKRINPDTLYEFLMKKEKIPLDYRKWTKAQKKRHEELTARAFSSMAPSLKIFLKNRLPILVDRTGRDYAKTMQQKKKLESLGYETAMVFVDVKRKVALKRNIERERKMQVKAAKPFDKAIRKVISKYKTAFGNMFYHIDNSKPITSEREAEFQKIREDLFRWIDSPPRSVIAVNWLDQQD